MQLLTLTLLSLGAITTALDFTKTPPEMAKLIPRSTWKAWQRRDNILAGGGWPLLAAICPVLSTQCTDGTCCPNSLVCDPTSGADFDVRAACCPDDQDCTTALVSTPFCADDSWELWETSLGNTSYFCCQSGQIGLQSIECISGKQVIDPSLTATSLGIITAGAVFQSGDQTKASVSSPTGSAASHTITTKPTTTSGGGSVESGLKSIASGLTHNGGNNTQKSVTVCVIEGVLGAIAALLL